MNNITQGLLTEGHRVKVLAVETPKHRVLSEKMPDNYLKSVDFESVFIDTTLSFWAAFKTIFTHTSYQVSRFYSKSFANKLTEILQKESFDIVQLDANRKGINDYRNRILLLPENREKNENEIQTNKKQKKI